MSKAFNYVLLLFSGLVVQGCSNVNQSLWHSLKTNDAIVHPQLTTEPNGLADPSNSYNDYANQRKALLNRNLP